MDFMKDSCLENTVYFDPENKNKSGEANLLWISRFVQFVSSFMAFVCITRVWILHTALKHMVGKDRVLHSEPIKL